MTNRNLPLPHQTNSRDFGEEKERRDQHSKYMNFK